jgi:hypothetical protein
MDVELGAESRGFPWKSLEMSEESARGDMASCPRDDGQTASFVNVVHDPCATVEKD